MRRIDVELPSDEILLEEFKKFGSFKMVAQNLGYNLNVEYRRIRYRFRFYIKEELWMPYLLSSRNKDKRVQVLRLREKGVKLDIIAERVGLNINTVSRIIVQHMSDYERTRARNLANAGGHSHKPIEKLTNTLCIKRRYIRLGIKEPICEICGWDYRKQELYLKIPENLRVNCFPIQLDHIDGNKENNNPSNHRFLCPNCHSLQPTSFRNKKKTQQLLDEMKCE